MKRGEDLQIREHELRGQPYCKTFWDPIFLLQPKLQSNFGDSNLFQFRLSFERRHPGEKAVFP